MCQMNCEQFKNILWIFGPYSSCQINSYWLKFLIPYHVRCVLRGFTFLFYLIYILFCLNQGKWEMVYFLFFPLQEGLNIGFWPNFFPT